MSISETNQAPVIGNLPASASALWGRTGYFKALAADSDLPANTLTWSRAGHDCPFAPQVDASSGEVTWTCGGVGQCSVDIVVTDDGAPSLSDRETLSLSCTNEPPFINAAPPGSIGEGQTYSVALTCTDQDGDPLTMNHGSGDSCGGTLTGQGSGTWLYAFTTDESSGGTTCQMEVDCSDSLATVTESTAVSIGEVNQAPVITNLPDSVSVHWRNGSGRFDVDATDSDLPADTLRYTLGNNNCHFNAAIVASTGEVTWSCGDVQTCMVWVQVWDDGSPAMEDHDQLEVKCTNQAPTLSVAAPASVDEGALYTAKIDCTDPDGDPLTVVKKSGDNCGATITANQSGGWDYAFIAGENQGGGSCQMAVTCSDTKASNSHSQAVTINELNQKPVFTNLPGSASAHWNSGTGTFTVSATDPDLPAQQITFSRHGDDCSFTPAVSASGTVSFACAKKETCLVQIKAEDSGTPAASSIGALTVDCTDRAPAFTSTAPVQVAEMEEYVYNITCADGDSDMVTITKGAGDTCGGQLTDYLSGQGKYLFTPGEPQAPGSCTIELICSDTQLQEVQVSTVSLLEKHLDPTWVEAPLDLTVMTGETVSRVIARAEDGDLPNTSAGDPGRLDCSAENITCTGFTPTVTGSGAGSVDCTLSFTAPGSETVCSLEVRVADGGGRELKKKILIEVKQTPSRIIYVDHRATGNSDGTSWEHAFTTVQAALDAAAGVAGDTSPTWIFVAQGTYVRSAYYGAVATFKSSNVELYGGFSGDEASLIERVGISAHPTVLDGEDNSRHVIMIDGFNKIRLDGLTIRRGKAWHYSSGDDQRGAGVFSRDVNGLTVAHCLIEYNASRGPGGGMYNERVTALKIRGTDFKRNSDGSGSTQGLHGGAIYNLNVKPAEISNCLFWRNANYGSVGAAIYNQDSEMVLRDSTLDFNYSSKGGGGLYVGSGSTAVVEGCTLSNNRANNGGGVMVEGGGQLRVTNTRFYRNQCSQVDKGGGGIFFNGEGGLTVDQNTFEENSCRYGGAIYFESGSGSVTNSKFISNRSGSLNSPGGGSCVFGNGYRGVVSGCTFEENESMSTGGVMQFTGGSPVIRQSGFKGSLALEQGGVIHASCPEGILIEDCTFNESKAYNQSLGYDENDRGGALYLEKAGTVRRSAFDNSRTQYGGALYLRQLDGTGFTIDECTIENGNTHKDGAGIYLEGGAVTITGTSFKDNYSSQSGSALYGTGDTTATISRSLFKSNFAYHFGGAIDMNGTGTVNVAESQFILNISYNNGGAIARPGTDSHISRTLFSGNYSRYKGGAVYVVSETTPSFENCLFLANGTGTTTTTSTKFTGEGGAVYTASLGGNPTFMNCTFAANSAADKGGAIYDDGVSTLTNCILWENLAPTDPAISGLRIVTYSDVQGGETGQGNISWPPLFGREPLRWYLAGKCNREHCTMTLAGDYSDLKVGDTVEFSNDGVARTITEFRYGGFYYTPERTGVIAPDCPMVAHWGSGTVTPGADFHLKEGSPCKDAGTATGAPAEDHDGLTRPSCQGYDMGGFEIQCP